MIRLDARLECCAKYVRRGAVLSDIGTDHAYLPAFLSERGLISRAVASDINEAPCRSAETTVRDAGVGDTVTVICTPGLDGVERFSPSDIVIAGMGGETVISILSAAPWVMSPDIRLILQPMTKQPEVRRWLAGSGFGIVSQDLARVTESHAGKNTEKIYEIIVAGYDGNIREISDAEAVCGLDACRAEPNLLFAHITAKLRYAKAKLNGLKQAAVPDADEINRQTLLVFDLETILTNYADTE